MEKNNNVTKPYRIWAKSAYLIASPIVSNSSSLFGFPKGFLQNWNNLLGTDARFVRPTRLALSTKKNEYILSVVIEDLAFWSHWKMMEQFITSSIEEFLGRKCKIKVEKV